MTLTVGTNSYCTLEELRAYALARGVTLSTTDSTVEVYAIKAMDYIEARRDKFQGYKTDDDQALQFPREYLYIDGALIDNDVVPDVVKNAQSQLVIDQHNGVDITPNHTSSSLPVIQKTVGPLTTKYSDKWGANTTPYLAKVNDLLKPVYKNTGMMSVHV